MGVGFAESVGLDRANLVQQTRSVLNRGGWGNADVLLVESDLGAVVVKDWAAYPLRSAMAGPLVAPS